MPSGGFVFRGIVPRKESANLKPASQYKKKHAKVVISSSRGLVADAASYMGNPAASATLRNFSTSLGNPTFLGNQMAYSLGKTEEKSAINSTKARPRASSKGPSPAVVATKTQSNAETTASGPTSVNESE